MEQKMKVVLGVFEKDGSLHIQVDDDNIQRAVSAIGILQAELQYRFNMYKAREIARNSNKKNSIITPRN